MASGLESEFATLHEIVKAAKIRLSPNIWDYLIGGTETETTLRRNRMALDSIAFKPRVLRDVSTIDPSSEIFGRKIRLPVMLAPVGSLESFESGGGITVARGAGGSQAIAIETPEADPVGAHGDRLHDVAAAAEGTVDNHLGPALHDVDDLRQDRRRAAAMVELAAAMVRTVDRPYAVLERDLGVLGTADPLEHEFHVGKLVLHALEVVP